MRTKIKSYNTEITINLNDKGPKERIKCAYLSAIERGLLGIFSITVHLPLKYAAWVLDRHLATVSKYTYSLHVQHSDTLSACGDNQEIKYNSLS